MAGRKKKDGEDGAAVVLEDLRSQFKVFGEALQGLREEVGAEFRSLREEVGAEFRSLREEVGAESRSLREEVGAESRSLREELDRRFDAVDARADRTNGEIVLVKAAVLEHSREIREVRGDIHEVRATVTRIELALDKKVDRDEVEAIVARAIGR